MPNPYPQTFLDLHADLPRSCIAVDLGSGKRSMDALFNVDYTEYSKNSLRGDMLALPFSSDCIDLILSQAVLEHVTNPDLAVQEMLRVLKPGGTLYVEAAFMQPVHMAPRHYFNITPYGLTWLLRNWEIIDQGTLSTFQDVIDWLMKEVGAPRLGWRAFRKISTEQYASVAYGVYAIARKPV